MTANQTPGRTAPASSRGAHAPAQVDSGPSLEDDLEADAAENAEGGVWWWALGLWLCWAALVSAFVWGYFELPSPDVAGFSAAIEAIGLHQRVVILAAALAPLPFLLMGAIVARDAGRLRQSAETTLALTRLTAAAQATPDTVLRGDVISESPAHIRREVERASHAIDALHVQLRNIEDALARQSSAIDAATDRAERRAQAIRDSLREEREAFEKLLSPADGLPSPLAGFGAGDAADIVDALRMQTSALERQVAQSADMIDSLNAEMRRAAELAQAAETDVVDDDRRRAAHELAQAAAEDVDRARAQLDVAADRINHSIEAAARSAVQAIIEAARGVPAVMAAGALSEEALSAPLADGADDAANEQALTRQKNLVELRRQIDRMRAAEKAAVQNRLFNASLREDAAAPNAAETLEQAPVAGPFDIPRPQTAKLAAAAQTPSALSGAGAALEALSGVQEAAPSQPGPRLQAEPLAAPPPLLAPVEERTSAEPIASSQPSGRRDVDWGKLVKAANFPDSENDHETLDALYHVLTDAHAAALLQCAEDSLVVLADLDIYVEDFTPTLAPVTVWRDYIDGDASAPVKMAAFDAPSEQERIANRLTDDSSLARLAARFCKHYEDMLRRMMRDDVDDGLAVDMADTRTGRAYMMMAQATGRLGAAPASASGADAPNTSA